MHEYIDPSRLAEEARVVKRFRSVLNSDTETLCEKRREFRLAQLGKCMLLSLMSPKSYPLLVCVHTTMKP